MGKAENFAVLGRKVDRFEGRDKVTGGAAYVADVFLPGMLTGRILRSPLPHARIRSIDASRAEKVRGVKAVVTADDTVKQGWGAFFPRPVPLVRGQGAVRGRGGGRGGRHRPRHRGGGAGADRGGMGRVARGLRRGRGHAGRRAAHPRGQGQQRGPHHRCGAGRRGRGLPGLRPGAGGDLRERAPVALGHRDHRQRGRLLGQRQVHRPYEHPDAVHGPAPHRRGPGRAGSRRAHHPDRGGRGFRRQVLRRQQRGGERGPGPQGPPPGEDHQHPGGGVPGRQPTPGQHEGVGAHGLPARRPDPAPST